jgi:hypothetical protein
MKQMIFFFLLSEGTRMNLHVDGIVFEYAYYTLENPDRRIS